MQIQQAALAAPASKDTHAVISIKTANFPLHKQKLAGFVVGFRGSKIYCLHYTAMQAPPTPLPRLCHSSHTSRISLLTPRLSPAPRR